MGTKGFLGVLKGLLQAAAGHLGPQGPRSALCPSSDPPMGPQAFLRKHTQGIRSL